MKNIRFKFIYIAFLLFILSLCSGCDDSMNITNSNDNTTLSDIAYDSKNKDNFTVYLLEDDIYQPYYVISNNYPQKGVSLLLRKYILENDISFNSDSNPISKYDGSVLDKYLNNDFCKVFTDVFSNKIQTVPVDTIKTEDIGKAYPETITIDRKIFLLSYTELGMSKSSTEAVEGKTLSYFSDSDSRISYKENGSAYSWWTRTAHNWGGDLAVGIAPDGTIGSGATSSLNGVRPAFCLPANTEITKKEGIVENEIVYVIA